MPRCNICNEDKSETEFSSYTNYSKGIKKIRLMKRCRNCQRLRVQAHRHKDIKTYNIQATDRHTKAKIKAIEYKGGKCFDCKGVFHSSVYDFHHLDPQKKDIMPSGALRRRFETAKAELDKCVLLCANCHRIRHYESK